MTMLPDSKPAPFFRPRQPRTSPRRGWRLGLAGLCLLLAASSNLRAEPAEPGLAAGWLRVSQLDLENTTNSVSVTLGLGINGLAACDGSIRGRYHVGIEGGSVPAVEAGVLLACAAENGRDNGELRYVGPNYCAASIDYYRAGPRAGEYYIAAYNAPTGTAYNVDVAAAFFSYTHWWCGYARNSANTPGGANDLFSGSPGLALGTHFVDQGAGISTVDLRGLGVDSRTDGILLVTHGGDAPNYALSMVNSNNGTWSVYVKANNADGAANQRGPVAFAFIPRTNTTVISGRFRGDGAVLLHSGDTPGFAIDNLGVGAWRLTIPGQSPATGVLLVSAEGGMSVNQDNLVTCAPDGAGWVLESRDLPGSPPSLQTPTSQPVASFVFLPAPLTARGLNPAMGQAHLGPATDLTVALSNLAPGAATVRFYGRVAPVAPPGPDFMIVALPDTQYYTAERFGGTKHMFISQTEWITTNRLAENIAYVAHLGDLSDTGDVKSGSPNLTEWRNATNALYRLESAAKTKAPQGVAYGVAVGNHDTTPNGDPTGTSKYYNQYFGVSHFNSKAYYAGHYGTNNNNHFDLFSVNGLEFVVIYFEYDTGANPAVLAWANEILRTNAHRRAIAVAHYMGSAKTPSAFSAQGAAIYNALRTNDNLFLMLGGHVNGEGSRQDNFNGHTVHTLISDYQFYTNGGNGLMRLMTFSPSNDVVVVQTYSPWTRQYETDFDSEFFFPHPMRAIGAGSPVTPFIALGTNEVTASGQPVSQLWSQLPVEKAFEWYVTVTDAEGRTVTSPTWRFTTATNSPPTAPNLGRTIWGDSPTNLTLAASDLNGDPVTFQLRTLPTQGIVRDFDPESGAFAYLPARGFRGTERFTFIANDGEYNSAVASVILNVVAPPDLNTNGIPDDWELLYGVSDPFEDADGDGFTNLEEYRANTNPTNAESAFRILSAEPDTAGGFQLSWASVGGTRYRVQVSLPDSAGGFSGRFTDLARELALELDTHVWGAASTQFFHDSGLSNQLGRFYRVRIFP